MLPGAHASPTGDDTSSSPGRRTTWRGATPVLAVACGALFAISAVNATEGDLRPARYVDLASFVQDENRDVQQLQQQVTALNDEVNRLTSDVVDADVRQNQERARKAGPSAGLSAVKGPGITVTLSDAPAEVINDSSYDPNYHVVHQQDISAVVNAMWAAGAEAITIQGQRIVTTTGIKCSGNAVRLQGLAFPQPYVISAIGDVEAMKASIDATPRVADYRQLAANPEIALGWELVAEPEISAPAYDGPTAMTYAHVVTG